MDHRIAIVGAGISGLALLHELRRCGADAVALEAEEEPGGVMRSVRVEGRVLDLGPQRTRLVPAVQRLLEELGLRDELMAARPGLPLFVWRSGRLRRVPRSAAELATTDLLSARAKLRLLLEPLTGPPRPDETVAELFVRSFGEEAYRALLGPLFGGIYGTDPARMRARDSLNVLLEEAGVRRSVLLAALRRFRAGSGIPAAVTFGEGMQRLPRALAEAHHDRVRLGTPVRSVERTAGGWRLSVPGGTLSAAVVVPTVPADAAAGLLRRAAPEAAARLDRLVYNDLVVVHLHAACELCGYGYQVAFGEGLQTRGVTWNAALFGRDGVHTAYLAGSREEEARAGEARQADGASDTAARAEAGSARALAAASRLGRTAAREFEVVTGCPARVLRVSRTRMPAFDLSWRALDRLSLPPGIRLCASYLSRPGITGRLAVARELAEELAAAG